MALSRWSWEVRQTDRQTGRRFSLLIHDTAAISTAAFCPDLICPASPTHKYFTNTSHTRNLVERPHTPGCHTPSLVLFHSPLWFRVLFFSYLPSAALCLSLSLYIYIYKHTHIYIYIYNIYMYIYIYNYWLFDKSIYLSSIYLSIDFVGENLLMVYRSTNTFTYK